MHKKVLRGNLFLLYVLIFGTQAFGQWTIPWQMRSDVTLDHLVVTSGYVKPDLLFGLPMTPGSSLEHNYIDRKWNNCSFLLFESEKLMEGYLAKYEITANKLEVKSKSGTKLIDISKIKSLVWLDSITNAPRYFINAKDYKEENVQVTGLLEVLVDGHMPLFAQSYLKEKEIGFFANLLSLFEKEKREKQYEINKFYYVGTGSSISKISSQKEFLLSFGDFYWEMEEFIQQRDLDISLQADLQKVFEYYNAKFERLPDY
ncbi:MAG: hypothetical protein AABY93_01340 [Bacteroidota bacterium]